MKTLVVYYSMGGNTKYAAEKIALASGADVLRIEPVKAYPDKGFRKFIWGGKSAVMAETPALLSYEFDSEKYGAVVFGFPVWASNVAPPIRTFVKDNKDALKDKQISAFACEGGSGAEKALSKLAAAIGIENYAHTAVLIDPKDRPSGENDEKIKAFSSALMGENDDKSEEQ